MVLPGNRFRASRKWSAFSQQRINKAGTAYILSGAYTNVLNWTSDTTFPGEVYFDSLRSAGAATAIVRAYIVPINTNGFYPARVRMLRNDVQIGSASANITSDTPFMFTVGTFSVANLDMFKLQGQKDGAGPATSIALGSYIEIVPT